MFLHPHQVFDLIREHQVPDLPTASEGSDKKAQPVPDPDRGGTDMRCLPYGMLLSKMIVLFYHEDA